MAVICFMTIMDNSHIMFMGIVSSILHEFGHIIAMMCEKRDVKQIKIGMFNVDILDSNRSKFNYSTDLTILFSGSLMNFVICILCIWINLIFKSYIIDVVGYENLFIGIVNLIPVVPLDGGQILFVLLSKKFDIITCEKIMQLVSFFTLLPLAILGFAVLIDSKYNFSLLFLCFYLLSFLLFKNDPFY